VSMWVTVFSPNKISGLRRPKYVKFGIMVVYNARMMHTHFWKKFLIVAKVAKNAI